MELIYAKSNWEVSELPLETFLEKAQADGFRAVEVYLQNLEMKAADVAAHVAAREMLLIAQVSSRGQNAEAQIEEVKELIDYSVEAGSVLINGHLGRDIFSFEENCRILNVAQGAAIQLGVPLVCETHRGRPLSTGPATRAYLEALPDLRLNVDFSHWTCAHESDLKDQADNVRAAINRADHIHARVGSCQGPQVPDPFASAWSEWTNHFMRYWQRIIDARKAEGCQRIMIVPEFGPPPYMQICPDSGLPVRDTWKLNVAMRDFLIQALSV